ncbi:MAG: AlpA family phage regulatory protein [Gammaproteobacteria bacterium]|nr:AlpA family phage regulatory protein [Gammaproteobacteria bacterium]
MRLRDVEATTALRKSKIYQMVKEGSFPAPIALTTKSKAWVGSEVNGWVRDKIAASRQGEAA